MGPHLCIYHRSGGISHRSGYFAHVVMLWTGAMTLSFGAEQKKNGSQDRQSVGCGPWQALQLLLPLALSCGVSA